MNGTWLRKNNITLNGQALSREAAIGVSCNGAGYMGFGNLPDQSQPNDLYRYNSVSDTWEMASPNVKPDDHHPSGREFASCFAIGRFIYLFGGNYKDGNLNDFWQFDTGNLTWKQLPAPTPGRARIPIEPRCKAVGFSLNGQGYIAFGLGDHGVLSDTYRYEPTFGGASGLWFQEPSCRTSRSLPFVFCIGTTVYVGGGQNLVGADQYLLSVFDGASWSEVQCNIALPYAAVAFTINSIGYVATGASDQTGVYQYAGNGQWNSVNAVPAIGPARVDAVGFTLDAQSSYVGAGFCSEPVSNLDDLWQFYPVAPASNGGPCEGYLRIIRSESVPQSVRDEYLALYRRDCGDLPIVL